MPVIGGYWRAKMTNLSAAGLCEVAETPGERYLGPVAATAVRQWYAVYTLPQNERSASAHLALRDIESYLPTYEMVRKWKNRQQVKLQLPLFPSYLFVCIGAKERSRVLAAPGVVRIVGTRRESIPIADEIIDFLRSDLCLGRAEPYRELVVGERVRIKEGSMQGVEGTLVRKNNKLRFVLSVEMIQRHVAIEIDADSLEPIPERW
jgi:transcription antitermination factor NusG